ncbi:MAG: DNA repair protein RecO [Desulfocapsaceae bacterium]|nr:DNA repair protein RecO [Desulfocapsaceae bacterium]
MSESSKESAAIVLDCQDHGESDQIVTFYCQNIGRMTGIAKGAKRSQKRFVNKLELFSLLSIRYTESRSGNLAFINEAELVESFIRLRQSMSLYLAATVVRELTLVATRDLEGDDGFFSLLQWGLQALDSRRPALTVLVFFQIKFYEQIGYRPNLGCCVHCNQPFNATQEYGFDSRAGGIVCRGCQGERGPATLPLARGTIKILQSAQNQPLDRLHRLHLSGSGLREALSLLYQYGRHLLQREICSLKVLSDAQWKG